MADTEPGGALVFFLQFVPLLILSAVLIPPFIRIFRRIGRSPWLSLLVLVPFGFVVLPWIIAYMRWDGKAADVEDVFR